MESEVLVVTDFQARNPLLNKLEQRREKRKPNLKSDFQKEMLDVDSVHWDAKLLPCLNVWNSKEECLPVFITFGGKEEFFAVSSTPYDWNLNDKVQIMRCETVASNTEHLNEAYIFETKVRERCSLLFTIILIKWYQKFTESQDLSLFKVFLNNWKNLFRLTFKQTPNSEKIFWWGRN